MRRLWPEPSGKTRPTDSGDEDRRGEILDAYEIIEAYRPPPRLRVNFVTSADGAVTVDGRSGGLSSPADQRLLGMLRQLTDVLLVGAGTLRIEGYGPIRLDDQRRRWRREHGLTPHPTLAIVSARLNLAPDHPALRDAPTRPVIVTHQASPSDRRRALAAVADVVVSGDDTVDLTTAVDELTTQVGPHILCEGGPHLFGSLTAADLVDELCLTISPQLAGPGAGRITAGPLTEVRGLALAHALLDDGNLFLRYTRRTA